jgi:drug/metabolite transporter (DMT)-like permease
MRADSNKIRALLYTFGCIALWSFIPVVSKLGQSTIDNYQYLFWSSLLSLGVVYIAALIAGKRTELKRYSASQIAQAFVLGFLGTFLYYLLLYYGYAHAVGLEVLALQNMWPMFVVLFSVLLLRERLTLRTVIAMIIGFFGVLLVLSKGQLHLLQLGSLRTDVVVLSAAIIFAVFSVLSKRVHFEAFSCTVYFFVSATVFSFLAMLIGSHFVIPQGMAWLHIIVNGAFLNGLSYILWLQALRYGNASFIAPFFFLTPVIAALLLVAVFHEPLLPAYFFGLAAVVVSGVIAK